MPNGVPDSSTPCTIELFPQTVPGKIAISYYVSETKPTDAQPYPDPTNIISWDQTVYVIVDIDLLDQVRRFLCGRLCIDVDVDTCGPAPDKQFAEKYVDLVPEGPGHYTLWIELPAGTFKPPDDYPARCGRVYRVCVTVGSSDLAGNPGLIWGTCADFELAVHDPVAGPVAAAS